MAPVLIITALYYWLTIGQLRGQVNRVLLILSINDAGASEAVSQTAGLSPPTVVIFGYTLPSILAWAAPLLAIAILIGYTGLIGVEKFYNKDTHFPYQYAAGAIVLFGGFGLSFAIGGQSAVRRILPSITIFTTPVIALIARDLQIKKGGKVLVLVLCSFVFIAAIISPAVAVADRSDSDFKPISTSSNVASTDWALEHGETVVSDSWVQGHLHLEDVRNGLMPTVDREAYVLSRSDAADTSDYHEYVESPPDDSIFIWQSYFGPYYNIQEPTNHSKVYHNGGDAVFSQ
jgi:hypothetical protein